MHLIAKIVITIVIIVIVVFLVLCINFNLFRYRRLQILDNIFELDRNYTSNRKRISCSHKVVITFTTIPDRLNLIYPTIASLFDQSVCVDDIILNVPRISRKGQPYIIPEWMASLTNLTINWVETDEGPATKLLPTLRKERSANGVINTTRIIVVDDDNIYHQRTIEKLLQDFEYHNNSSTPTAITKFGVILDSDRTIPAFTSFRRCITLFQCQQEVDLLQGCFGFVVLSSFFPDAALKIENRPDFAVSVDDIWFSCWLKLNGVRLFNTGHAFWTLPLFNLGEVDKTTKLVDGENAGLVRDHKTLEWFHKNNGYKSLKG
tara:strand:- start:118095 stop:119051 length:957 start_codon:yes stop_codon:yes gene_type:complete